LKEESNNDKKPPIKKLLKINNEVKIRPPWNNDFKDKVNAQEIKK